MNKFAPLRKVGRADPRRARSDAPNLDHSRR
jgi:hypothetical protein